MRKKSFLSILIGASLLLVAALILIGGEAEAQDGGGPTMDHSLFAPLKGPFESGPDVTAACLICHPQAAAEIQQTIHWTWEYQNEATGQTVGKRHVINNYCVATATNEPRCTSCHAGYGWRDDTFDFAEPTNIDCLVCHDTTGTYKKFPTAAGHPAYEPMEFDGKTWEPPDLAAVAQAVGPTSVQTCGACHFFGGGGDAVKHGDLDTTLINADFELDVHMDVDGLAFTCTTCHVTNAHQIDGSRYDVPVAGDDIDAQVSCAACHTAEPHAAGEMSVVLNDHTAKIACQTCHIPEFARAMPTKMWWDWSAAGQMNDEGKPFTTVDDAGVIVYDTKKGSFEWQQNVVPEYVWFNGTVIYTLIDTVIDPTGVVPINVLEGTPDDPDARIWPVKNFGAIQPYDPVNNTLVAPHLFPSGPDDTTAYWKFWDWNAAIQTAMDTLGAPYSGQYDWVETQMMWPISHMVAPAANALACEACHVPNGRLAGLGLPAAE